jgi:hypothetical protein
MSIYLEEGKTYKTRDGRKAIWRRGPDSDGDICLYVEDDKERLYKKDGQHGGYSGILKRDSNLDIVSEWSEEQSVKQPKYRCLLQDLDVRKGDVVRMVWNNILMHESDQVETITKDGSYSFRSGDSGHGFDIVSRAEDTAYKKVKDMSDAELGALVHASNSGEDIEVRREGSSWRYISTPSWEGDYYYRVKPKPTRDRFLMDVSKSGFPYVGTQSNKPTHSLTFVWEDGELVDVEVRKCQLPT